MDETPPFDKMLADAVVALTKDPYHFFAALQIPEEDPNHAIQGHIYFLSQITTLLLMWAWAPTQIKPLWHRPPQSRVKHAAQPSHTMPINSCYWQHVTMTTAKFHLILTRLLSASERSCVTSLFCHSQLEPAGEKMDETGGRDFSNPWKKLSLVILLFCHSPVWKETPLSRHFKTIISGYCYVAELEGIDASADCWASLSMMRMQSEWSKLLPGWMCWAEVSVASRGECGEKRWELWAKVSIAKWGAFWLRFIDSIRPGCRELRSSSFLPIFVDGQLCIHVHLSGSSLWTTWRHLLPTPNQFLNPISESIKRRGRTPLSAVAWQMFGCCYCSFSMWELLIRECEGARRCGGRGGCVCACVVGGQPDKCYCKLNVRYLSVSGHNWEEGR